MGLMNTLFDKNDRKAIALDPSYISKSGKQTPWIGYFWSGSVGQAKRGLEILGVGAIDIDKRYCVMLKAEQTPDTITLDNEGCTLIGWYLKVLERIRIKGRLLEVSNYVVADAYFSKATFVQGLDSMGFYLVSRLRDDANLMYIHDGQPTGKKVGQKFTEIKLTLIILITLKFKKLKLIMKMVNYILLLRIHKP